MQGDTKYHQQKISTASQLPMYLLCVYVYLLLILVDLHYFGVPTMIWTTVPVYYHQKLKDMDLHDHDINHSMDQLYKELMLNIPDILKEQLTLCGYTNGLAITNASDNWIETIENYIKTCLKGQSLEVIKKYGGEFCTKAEDFRILPGHINLLKHLRDEMRCCKRKRDDNDNVKKRIRNSVQVPQVKETDGLKSHEKKVKDQIICFLKSQHFSAIPIVKIFHCINKKGTQTLSGTVSCVICDREISIHYDVYNRVNKRWIVSNYVYHIKEHLEPDKSLKGFKKKEPQAKIYSYFQHSSKNSSSFTREDENGIKYVENEDHNYSVGVEVGVCRGQSKEYVDVTELTRETDNEMTSLEGQMSHSSKDNEHKNSRYLSSSRTRVNEGELRITQLEEYLDKRQLGRIVWMSEDATRIIDRVEYDPVTNTLVGLVVPLKDGLPVNNYFRATNAKTIEQHILNFPPSKLAYTVMVQPLEVKTPAFCVAIFGTDNRFTAKDAISRWNLIKDACATKGITVLGVSGDGDSRILKAMEICSEMGNCNDKLGLGNLFCMPLTNKTGMLYVQDTTHIGNKLKNRLFTKEKCLKMGTFNVSIEHLIQLTKIVHKDEHFIRQKDLDGSDRMNYEAVTRISNEKVQNLLEKHIDESKGTQIYLKAIRYCTEPFLNENMEPLQRLRQIWFSVFLFRIWRHWISNTNGYTLGNNFITRNSYMGVELNAHALTLLILNKNIDLNNTKFLPDLFSSQPCEKFFRTLRSMTSTLSTVVNFSMLEILYRIGRIDVEENLNLELTEENILLPRFKERLLGSNFNWPTVSKEDVNNAVIQAEHEALLAAMECDLGVDGHFQTNFECKITHQGNEVSDDVDNYEINEVDHEEIVGSDDMDVEFSEIDQEDVKKIESLNSVNLKNFKDISEDEESRFVTVQVGDKAPIVVKKSSLVWLLRKQSRRISSDRLHRFKN